MDLFVALEMDATIQIVNATKTTKTTSKSVALEMSVDASHSEASASLLLLTTAPMATSSFERTKRNVTRHFVRQDRSTGRKGTRPSSQTRCAASEKTATKQNARHYKIAAPNANVARCTIRKSRNGNSWAENAPRNVLHTDTAKIATRLKRMAQRMFVQRENAAVAKTLNWWWRIAQNYHVHHVLQTDRAKKIATRLKMAQWMFVQRENAAVTTTLNRRRGIAQKNAVLHVLQTDRAKPIAARLKRMAQWMFVQWENAAVKTTLNRRRGIAQSYSIIPHQFPQKPLLQSVQASHLPHRPES